MIYMRGNKDRREIMVIFEFMLVVNNEKCIGF